MNKGLINSGNSQTSLFSKGGEIIYPFFGKVDATLRENPLGKASGEILSHKINLLTFIFMLAITLIISGCSLHKSQISEPLIEIPPAYSTEVNEPAPHIGKWWEQYGDEQLNFLMEESLQHNLDIAQAYERLLQSIATVRIVNSSRGVTLDIEGSGGRGRMSSITEDTYTLSAAARYEIDLWGKLKSRTEAARYDSIASEEDVKTLFISISAQVADFYYLAVEQRAQLALTDQTIDSFQDTLERVERRYRGGLVPAIDVYQSRQNLASAKAARPRFESNLALTLNALSVLLGRFPDEDIGGSSDDLRETPLREAGLPSQLLTNRPDIKAALARLNASDERIGAAIADRFPSFNLIGSYGGASDEVHSVLDSPNIFWNILLQTVQPVLDGGRRKAEVDRSESIFREDLALYHRTVLNAFQEVEDALKIISTSKERIAALTDTVSASDGALRLALDRYMLGLTDYLPVLTEQVRNATSKSDLLEARRQLISGRIQLARALGGEWVDDAFDQYVTLHNKGAEKK